MSYNPQFDGLKAVLTAAAIVFLLLLAAYFFAYR